MGYSTCIGRGTTPSASTPLPSTQHTQTTTMALIIDSSTGTVLTAQTCYFLPDDTFTDEEWEQIDDFSDSEIGRIGKENGVNVQESEGLLRSISDALWGDDVLGIRDWNADTLNAIADAIRNVRPDLVGEE